MFVRPSTQKWVQTAAEEQELTGRRSRGTKATVCLGRQTAAFKVSRFPHLYLRGSTVQPCLLSLTPAQHYSSTT